ncbi:hypothetical protein PINS_up002771 [Pythium insidiosum]|nr:hypothetical protein PINS_up002771 [Pythium insidiosum]
MNGGGSFRDLDLSKPQARGGGVNGAQPARGTLGAGASGQGVGNGAASALNNYSTFQGDPSMQALMRTSDRIETSKKMVAESEQVAKHTLVDLELQREQLVGMKGMVAETSSMTSEAKELLRKIADRNYRRKLFLYLIIVVLAVTDIVVFYLLFIKRADTFLVVASSTSFSILLSLALFLGLACVSQYNTSYS